MSGFSGPEIVNNGLVLHLDASNPRSYPDYNMASYSQDFTNAYWSKNVTVSSTTERAPDGTYTASILSDTSAAAYQSMSRTFTVPADTSSYNVSLYIKRTTSGSLMSGVNVSFTGGTTKNYTVRLNSTTGAIVYPADTTTVTSEPNGYWRLSFTVSNNGTAGNTTLNVAYYPATGLYETGDAASTTGSQTVWGLQVTRGATLLPYRATQATNVATWYDLSGNGNHMTLYNYPQFSVDNLTFIGANQYARTTNTLDLSPYDSVTVEICLKVNSLVSTGISFEHGTDWNSVQSGFGLVPNSSGTTTYVGTTHHTNHRLGSGAVNYSTPVTGRMSLHTNIWSRVVDTTGRLPYINADERPVTSGSKTTGAYPAFRNDYLYLSSRAGTSSPLNQSVYYMKIYGRKLTPYEIRQNYIAFRGRYGI